MRVIEGVFMEIQKLTSEVIDKIAAGEVVERPAHLLKELLENSIDAGSTKIDVQIDQGGEWIKVIDNGRGIYRDDLPLVFARHATSKISEADDLWKLKSFGFRGEALASISAVSRTQILSRHNEEKSSFKIDSQYGKISEVQPTGALDGTTVLVEDLFGNVPARKKFLKSQASEISHIKNTVKALALANPSIEFKLKHKQELIYFWPVTESMLKRSEQVLEISPLYQVLTSHDGLELDFVYTAPSDVAKSSKNMWYFVQGRWVQDKSIHAAVMEAFRQLLMHGEYPQCVLSLNCSPDFVDVNIHPTKSQIKFLNSQKVFQFIHNAIRSQLEMAPWLQNLGKVTKHSLSSEVSVGGNPNRFEGNSQVKFDSHDFEKVSFSKKPSFFEFQSPVKANSIDLDSKITMKDLAQAASYKPKFDEEKNKNVYTWSALQVIGQLNNTYIVCQSDECLILVDQHAAHERVVFERLMRDWKLGSLPTQTMLIPLSMQLEDNLCETLLSYSEKFKNAGLEIEQSGPGQIAIQTMPAFMKEAAVLKALDKFAREASENSGSFAFENAVADFFATMSCHSVVRAGQILNTEQMKELLEQMDEFPLSSFCPHGRPVSIEYSFSKIEREFGRLA